MAKKGLGRKKLVGVIGVVALLVITIFAVVTFIVTRGGHAPSVAENTVGIKGKVVCLPHRDTEGPQTMECALGLQGDDGKYYGLSDTNSAYANISQLATDKRVEIIGSVMEIADTRYNTAGTIRVTRINHL